MKQLLIFDLDGTLLNTLADLANSTNHALQSLGYPTHEPQLYRQLVGNGIQKLFERALPEGEKSAANVLRMKKAFIPYYHAHNTEQTRPYPGICSLLETLQNRSIQLAVASNKYQEATTKLIAHFFPHIRFTAVFGQREGIPVKPDPAVVHEIFHLSGVAAAGTLFVGDSAVDMLTAAHAGVQACGVTWGFRPRAELEAMHPAYLVDRVEALADILTPLTPQP
ncbi:MAG: HAD family hydrolase [Prevotellaceae bacterium]|jgi:phosphoglycolate phosphatase|nr:HAD family hydrolase [Prevotellaceae bacterium]